MKSFEKKVIVTSFFILFASLNSFASATKIVKTDIKKESYSIGFTTGQHIVNQIVRQKKLGLETDIKEVLKGFSDSFKNKSKLSDDEIITFLNNRVETLNRLQSEKIAKMKKENLDKGKKYLAQNRLKKGVKVSKSGLEYEVIKKAKAKGKKPEASSIVVVDYEASLIDGTVFDSTYKRKMPAHLSMINIIEGLQEGLLMMQEGDKYRFTFPSELAYKEEGVAEVPPNSVIIFEIELKKVLAPGEFKKMMHQKADIKDNNSTKKTKIH